MDDIYENLDNYCFNQVQTENLELKNKLQEITCQLTNVQSDYDNLKKEFQKLETHYSSLLKTAKAEIQRKTALISTLNTEKDKLIITHVLNGGVRNSYHEKARYERGNNTNNEQEKKINNSSNESKKTEDSKIKDPRVKESVHEYRTESRKPYFDEECQRTKYSRSRSKDKCYSNKGDIKSRLGEKPHRNIVKHLDDRTCDDKSYNKIAYSRQRGKSAHGQKTRYISSSSDGENNENESRGKYKNRLIREHYRKQSHSPIIIERDRLSRHDGRYDKYIENNRGRSRENMYSRKSPMLEHSTINRSRGYRDSVNNQTDRRSNECVRDLYSPSSFNSKDIAPKDLLHDKNKESNIETRPIKHKLNSDEQIKNKRFRTDEENIEKKAGNQESCKNDKSKSLPYNDSEPAPKDDVDSISGKINQHEKRDSVKDKEEPKTIPNPKESNITDIDLKTRFDDPRLSSNKYVKVLDAKDHSYITTIVGNDVDLKYIKYDDKPQLTFPTPLNCLDLDENHVNEIYMDINMSPESGELIDSESNDVYFSELSDQCDKSLSSRKNNTNDILPNRDKKQLNVKESTDDASFLPEESSGQACEMTLFGNYKIPKISDTTKRDLIKTSTMGRNNKKSSGTSNNNDKILTHDKGPSQSNILKEVTKTDFINKMKELKDAESPKYRQFIAQDLELSDENNDTQELSDISDATLNTTTKESLNCNTEQKSSQKHPNKSELITSKCLDLFGDSLISPEDLELSDRTNSTPLKTKDDTALRDKKILQEDIMLEDRSDAITCIDKNERSSKSKEKLKHKEKSKEKSKKSSKKDNDKPVDTSGMTVFEKDKPKKDISSDVIAPAQVLLPVRDTINVMDNEQCSGDKAEDVGSPNVSIYEVTSSVPASRITSPTQSPTSASGSTDSPRPDVSQPDIRIVIKRRRTLKKKLHS